MKSSSRKSRTSRSGRGSRSGSGSASSPRRADEGKKRVQSKKRRTPSSRRWIHRQINDEYVRRAKAHGYASRAAYKLLEMDERFKILSSGKRVIDLGAAPGGWTKVAVERTRSTPKNPLVAGIDLLGMESIPGAVIFEMDFLDSEAPRLLSEALEGKPPDVILSDMAASVTGHRRTDQLRTMSLAEAALDFALESLAEGGDFLCKTFQGGTQAELLERMKRNFSSVRHVKPPASRKESVELYLLARGFRGRREKTEA